MTHSTTLASAPALPAIEYAVYTFDLPADGKTHSRWNRHVITRDLSHAMAEAKDLLGTRRFMKVEIKKKFICPKTHQAMDMTFKTLKLTSEGARLSEALIAAAVFSGVILTLAARGFF